VQVASSSDSVTLQWTAPPDNGAAISGYTLEVDDGRGGDFRLAYTGSNTKATVEGLQVGPCCRDKERAQSYCRCLVVKRSCCNVDAKNNWQLVCEAPLSSLLGLPPEQLWRPHFPSQSGLPFRFRLQADNIVSADEEAHDCNSPVLFLLHTYSVSVLLLFGTVMPLLTCLHTAK
jgi:hypothetical protein